MSLRSVSEFSYETLMTVASIGVAPLFLFSKRGRKKLKQRFGFWNLNSDKYIWLHGASVGEVAGLIPVIQEIKKRDPETKILLTSTSVTGLERAEGIADEVRLLPFDSRLWLRHALGAAKIRALIINETELWLGLVRFMAKRDVPVYFINARVSDFSLKRYEFIRKWLSSIFDYATKILPASQEAKERLESLGAPSTKMKLLGNSKYDFSPVVKDRQEVSELKRQLFNNVFPILVLASIRPGEEYLWFDAISQLRRENNFFNVVVAPRHQEKFSYFEEKLAQHELRCIKWTEIKAEKKDNASHSTILLDSIGDLPWVYACADLVFVGATLVDLGGHNPLEPAAYGTVVCVGPYVTNIRDVISQLKTARAIIEISSVVDAKDAIQSMIQGSSEFLELGKRAKNVWQANSGVSAKIIEEIRL